MLTVMAPRCSRVRCLQTLRENLGNEPFWHIASYVPASFQLGLSPSEEDCMVKLFQLCIHEHHWLAFHIDRPHARRKISAPALVKAMKQSGNGSRSQLDADGVYALSVLCNFSIPATIQFNISDKEIDEGELLDSGSDSEVLDQDEVPHTPLS